MKPNAIVIGGSIAIVVTLFGIEEWRLQESARITKDARVQAEQAQSERDKEAAEKVRLKERNTVFVDESAALRKRLTELRAAKTITTDPGEDRPATDSRNPAQLRTKALGEALADPKVQDALRTQQLAAIKKIYGNLVGELGVTPEQEAQVQGYLSEQAMAISALALNGFDRTGSDASATAAKADEMRKIKNHYDDLIKGVIGEEKSKDFEQYRRGVPDRMTVAKYQKSMSTANAPIDDAQTGQLLRVMADERNKMMTDQSGSDTIATKVDDIRNRTGAAAPDSQELNKRVLARARDFLTPDQILALEGAQNQKAQLHATALKMSRTLQPGRSTGTGVPQK